MAQHGRRYSSARSKRTSRKVNDATIGTHVSRRSSPSRASSRAKTPTYSDARIAARASESHIDSLVPAASSGEDAATYRRRSQHRRYVESVQRRARLRRVITALVVVLLVVGLAIGAGLLAFRGVLGSQMALRDSDARDALSAPAADETVYTLVAAELGATAAPLAQDGPDLLALVVDDRAANKVSIIGVPASLKVTIDNDTKRLADMALGGDAALISAVESYTKLDIHHFVKIPEGGIAGIVDALGDVDVEFKQVVDDPHAGDVYFPLGTYTLNGSGALTYLRASNLHMGKSDQVLNQATFLKTLLLRLAGAPQGFTPELDKVDDYFQTDLALADLEAFAARVTEVGDQGIACDMVPGYFSASSDIVGDNSELFVSKPNEFAEFIQKLAGTADVESSSAAQVPSADPSSFTVEVRNGTDITGAGKTIGDALSAQGFRITEVGNAEQQVYDETLVIFRTKNTPAPSKESAAADEGATEDADATEEESLGEEADGAAQQAQASSASSAAAAEADLETQRAQGSARCNAVIDALGIGRVVEGDMYYSFDADVLLVVGYDYKPVS